MSFSLAVLGNTRNQPNCSHESDYKLTESSKIDSNQKPKLIDER